MRSEPEARLNHLTEAVIGAAIEVHTHLGPGFLESTYEAAMAVELGLRGIPHQRQAGVQITYKGSPVGQARIDLLVAGTLVIELKAVSTVLAIHRAQLIAYLKALSQPLGLLLNFNVPLLRHGIERVVRTA